MVQTLGTTADTNDIYLGTDGNLAVLSGLPAVEAACATATKAQLGEMIYATTQGIPNFQAIWVGVPNYQIWESYLRNTITSVPGVTNIAAFSYKAQNNILSYTATISTQYGTGNING